MIEINNILDVEKYIDDIDAVIFDLDDTLYSEKDYVRSGYKLIAETFKILEMEKELWDVFEKGGKAIDEVLKKHNLLDKKEEALQIYRYQIPNIKLYDGVKEMISRIKLKKKVGIITDGRPEGQRAKIKALKLDEIIDNIIITDELGGIEYRKPNSKAFELMQERVNVPFGKMIYVGDNIKKDFVACEKLGIKSMRYNNYNGIYR